MQILNYITYQSEERPFPFSPFPEGKSEAQRPKTEEKEHKRVTKKKKTTSKTGEN